MKIYVDEEFTGLTKDTDLISIGLVAENGSTFYGEIKDFDITKCNKWVKDNVVSKLKYYGKYNEYFKETENPLGGITTNSLEILDTKYIVGIHLNLWLNSFLEEIQFVSDVGHYDFVLLIDLITLEGCAIDLPEYISPALYDINQLIAQKLNLTVKEAFNYSREQLLSEMHKADFLARVQLDKHNALYDALVIKELYHSLSKDLDTLEEIRDTYTTFGDITLEQYKYLQINFVDLWNSLENLEGFLEKLDNKIEEVRENKYE